MLWFFQSISESIGYAAASILEGTIPNAYRETFQNILLPGFEKASMAMFMQINQTFQQGTKQCKRQKVTLLDKSPDQEIVERDQIHLSSNWNRVVLFIVEFLFRPPEFPNFIYSNNHASN